MCVRVRENMFVYTRRIEEAEEHHWFEMRKMERLIQAKARERDDVCLPPPAPVFLDFCRVCSQSHTLVVKRLRWRPRICQQDEREGFNKNYQSTSVQLASAGADHTVKIFNINTLTL